MDGKLIDKSVHAKAYDGTKSVAALIAKSLCLGATPIFAAMALLTGNVDVSGMSMSHGAGIYSLLTGMPVMYWLMSLFHAAPWLKLFTKTR